MRTARVHLFTFYDTSGQWKGAANRLIRNAQRSRRFETISAITDRELAESFPSEMKSIRELAREEPRGFGLWAWKPLVGKLAFSRVPEGDIILYLDAGCILNLDSRPALDRFDHYLDLCTSTDSLFFQQSLIEKNWTSHLVLDHFKEERFLGETGQLLGGIWFLRSTTSTEDFLCEWWDLVSRDGFALLRGDASGDPAKFHRHDQSILSCLAKSHRKKSIPDETYFSPDWDLFGRSFPIWATRLRLPYRKAYRNTFLWRILRALERFY